MAEQFPDDFWSIAFLTNNDTVVEQQDDTNIIQDNNVEDTPSKSFNFFPPESCNSDVSLTIKIQMKNHEGVLGDVSGIPWDASLLLAGFLYGSHEGRCLCSNACSCDDIGTMHEVNSKNGGILELGSGLGIVGLAAVATVMACSEETCNNSRVVLTDMNNDSILTHLRRNVDANVHLSYLSESNDVKNTCNVSVEGCDWMEVSCHVQAIMSRLKNDNQETKEHDNYPRGPFNLILGSALIYLPEHAAACADTLYYYLGDSFDCKKRQRHVESKRCERQAILVQLPDRSGFTTHFLPRCYELGLNVCCKEFENSFIERIEAGLKKPITSARDYRMYFISKRAD